MNKKIITAIVLVILFAVGLSCCVVTNNEECPECPEEECIGINRIYDVNRDGKINFQDAGLCWVYIQDEELHCEFGDLLYDVNIDGVVDMQDSNLIWINRD